MRKRIFSVCAILLFAVTLFSSCALFHEHAFGEWEFNGVGHYKECSCGYTLSENVSKHIDKDKDEACDLCRYPMKYEINSLRELSWYLLYYYELNQYEYLDGTNMKSHSIHEMNFKNTLTYNESNSRVKFETPYFNEYLSSLPNHTEYIKSNTEYYSYNMGSWYVQVDIPINYYLFETQETIQYGSSDRHSDYKKFTNTDSKFKTVNEFYETTSSQSLTKKIFENTESYDKNNISLKNEITNSVINDISHFIRYYLNVEFTDHGDIILPEDSYFESIDVKTEDSIVYFSVVKNDGKTFFNDDIRYSINGTINLKTHDLSYNIKRSYYFGGELMSYVDYDYNLTLTSEPIEIKFDFNGEFEEVLITEIR